MAEDRRKRYSVVCSNRLLGADQGSGVQIHDHVNDGGGFGERGSDTLILPVTAIASRSACAKRSTRLSHRLTVVGLPQGKLNGGDAEVPWARRESIGFFLIKIDEVKLLAWPQNRAGTPSPRGTRQHANPENSPD